MVSAKFIGMQDMGDGTFEPLFNIVGNHVLQDSTVGLATLNEQGITVPNYKNDINVEPAKR